MPGIDYAAPKAPASPSAAPMKPQNTGWPTSPRDDPVSPISSIDEVHLSPFLQSSRNASDNPEERPDWTTDAAANALWARLSAPEASGSVAFSWIVDVASLQLSFVRHVINTAGRTHLNMDDFAGYQAAAHTYSTGTMRWNATQQHHARQDCKRVYYLSLEFLMGRSLDNAILALGLSGVFAEALRGLGMGLEELVEQEKDAALGNGGLGRLAACFMDSLATLNYAAWGYGLRYTYGIFKQLVSQDGSQQEVPDYWLTMDNPWEIPRFDVVYSVRFYGHVSKRQGRQRWHGGEKVLAIAYDLPIPGFATANCINIRLWSSKPKKQFDLQSFNEGNYQLSVDEQQRAEQITSVLYPNDNTMAGKELRLKQQYFFVSATLQDIVRRFKKTARPWSAFPDQVAIQLNDTHPSLGIAELQRLLVDIEGVDWDAAWSIVRRTYAFTNHTVLPEAMEKWPVHMLRSLLPRHLQIILDINLYFLQAVERRFPNDRARLARMSIIEEGPQQQVRMAHLAIVGSHHVNGVAAIHSSLLRQVVFRDFADFYGEEKFGNKTNGITPRRWLHQANPRLSRHISEALGGDAWLTDLDELQRLKPLADDPAFVRSWMDIKRANKERLAALILERCAVRVDPAAMYDVQVKRIHEYKRQFMNILHVIDRHLAIKRGELHAGNCPPRVVIFGGKAAPGYFIAKLVIKLINDVARAINGHSDLLTVVFIPDYNVSLAEVIVPASDISEHISTAGTEASGTSNMKFVLNGGLIIGTLDGANIEILEAAGSQSCFIFGAKAEEVDDLRHAQRYREHKPNPRLEAVLDAIKEGTFGDPEPVMPLLDTVTVDGDYYLIGHDFDSSQRTVDEAFMGDAHRWAQAAIRSAASMGRFSSDRTIREYAKDIWDVKPCKCNDTLYFL